MPERCEGTVRESRTHVSRGVNLTAFDRGCIRSLGLALSRWGTPRASSVSARVDARGGRPFSLPHYDRLLTAGLKVDRSSSSAYTGPTFDRSMMSLINDRSAGR